MFSKQIPYICANVYGNGYVSFIDGVPSSDYRKFPNIYATYGEDSSVSLAPQETCGMDSYSIRLGQKGWHVPSYGFVECKFTKRQDQFGREGLVLIWAIPLEENTPSALNHLIGADYTVRTHFNRLSALTSLIAADKSLYANSDPEALKRVHEELSDLVLSTFVPQPFPTDFEPCPTLKKHTADWSEGATQVTRSETMPSGKRPGSTSAWLQNIRAHRR